MFKGLGLFFICQETPTFTISHGPNLSLLPSLRKGDGKGDNARVLSQPAVSDSWRGPTPIPFPPATSQLSQQRPQSSQCI